MQEARSIYEVRMHKVVEYIDRHLDATLDLNEIAEVANFSAFHFHRLFAAWMGERLGDYVRRRRLEVAAFRLASQPRSSVLEIALSVGFGSAEAFTRAFKTRFGNSPSAWRQARKTSEDSNLSQMISKFGQVDFAQIKHNEVSSDRKEILLMQVKLEILSPVNIAYLRHIGPYGADVSRFWRDTVMPWLISNDMCNASRFGIAHDDPSFTDERLCRYDVGVECDPQRSLLGNPIRTTLPGGLYAVLPFQGNNSQVVQAWTALFREWLPQSGMQIDARPCFERYGVHAKFDHVTGIFDCDICIPVAPL